MKAAAPQARAAGHPTDDSSSSPLVPILIAIAALAAIAAGVFFLRQRNQRRDSAGPSLSTKAG